MAFNETDHPRIADGTFTEKPHSAPEATVEQEPLTDRIAEYLEAYDAAAAEYEENGEGYGRDADDAYEAWEDFQTDNSGLAYTLLEDAKGEIERLRAELAKRTVPDALRARIDLEFLNSDDEPLVYVPEDGNTDPGYADAIAVVDGQAPVKFTLNPEGDILVYPTA